MCGRFVRYSTIHDLAVEFHTEEPPFNIPPSYNIAPSHEIAVITGNGNRRLLPCRWGFIPHWSKDPAAGYKMINARAESVAEKPAYKGAFMSGRVLIPADGFYEWQKEGREKIPHYISLKSGRPFGLAGILSLWAPPGGEKICTCSIITTRAESPLDSIHERMPVIVHKEDEEAWLDHSNHDRERLISLLRPYAPEAIRFYRVSTLVNSPRNNSPECIKKV